MALICLLSAMSMVVLVLILWRSVRWAGGWVEWVRRWW